MIRHTDRAPEAAAVCKDRGTSVLIAKFVDICGKLGTNFAI
jgi:hypothetical protein